MRPNLKSASQHAVLADRSELERLLRLASALLEVPAPQPTEPKRTNARKISRVARQTKSRSG